MDRYPTPDMDSYAGMLDRRFEAFLLDGLILVVVLSLPIYLGSSLLFSGTGSGFVAVMLFLPFAVIPVAGLYKIAFEGYYVATIGKHLRGIVVVKRDGSPMTWEASLIRNLLRVVDSLPSFYLVGLVSGYASDVNQRLGDRLGDTVVVYRAE